MEYYSGKNRRENAMGLLLIVGNGRSNDSDAEIDAAARLIREVLLSVFVEVLMNLHVKAKNLECLSIDSGKVVDSKTLSKYTGSPLRVFNYDRNSDFTRTLSQLVMPNSDQGGECSKSNHTSEVTSHISNRPAVKHSTNQTRDDIRLRDVVPANRRVSRARV